MASTKKNNTIDINSKLVNELTEKLEQAQAEIVKLQTLIDSKDKQIVDLTEHKNSLYNKSNLLAFEIVPATFPYKNQDGVVVNLKQGSILLVSQNKYDKMKQKFPKYTDGKTMLDNSYLEPKKIHIDE